MFNGIQVRGFIPRLTGILGANSAMSETSFSVNSVRRPSVGSGWPSTRRLKSRYRLKIPLPTLGEGFRVRAKGVQIYAALY